MYIQALGTTVVKVKLETDVIFLRKRAWISSQLRREQGEPLNPDMVRLLVIPGDKKIDIQLQSTPDAA